jgi:hypothetical protein
MDKRQPGCIGHSQSGDQRYVTRLNCHRGIAGARTGHVLIIAIRLEDVVSFTEADSPISPSLIENHKCAPIMSRHTPETIAPAVALANRQVGAQMPVDGDHAV